MILILILFNSICYANNKDYPSAKNAAISAVYKQTGLESDVNTYVKNLDEKYIPKSVHDVAPPALILLDYINNHGITFKWEF